MSPEQARGKAVDARCDIWAFGCVLFEMLTGARAFDGATFTDVLASIVTREPDWQALPAATPQQVRSLVARCLRKNPAERLRDIADGRFQIEEAMEERSTTGVKRPAASRTRERTAWVAAALSAGAAVLLAVWPSRDAPARNPVTFQVFAPERTVFSGSINTTVNVPTFALSPDGHTLAFGARKQRAHGPRSGSNRWITWPRASCLEPKMRKIRSGRRTADGLLSLPMPS